MGGLKINTHAQVIDVEGHIIEGLYAAGEVAGGIHAGNRLGGNALADILLWSHCRSKCCNEINDGRVGGHLR